ncbi:hypothetical protein [Ruminococcus sp.]|uniref:hypothetical protein n=1 Tax=Ruminococcus sp. TaxID=41978 RepID=UPI0025D65120|nr:hypothetical protein [Ruminococcus sp.]
MKIKERIAKLIDVKSIITLTFTYVFAYMVITGKDIPDYFATAYTSILIFYFGSQLKKLEGNDNEKRN